ncbi:hypothetical protein, partial [Streptococcus pneumoniae]
FLCFVVYCFHKNSITLFTVTEQVYFLSNKEMYSLAIEFIQELEDTIKKVEDGKIQGDNQKLISICLVLSDAMKWEKEYFNDITSSKMKEIKKKYNMA